MESARLAVAVFCSTAATFVVVRFFALGLAGRYRWFLASVIFSIGQCASALFPYASPAHYRFFHATEPIAIALSIMAVVELWRLVASRYSGIDRVERRFAFAVVGTAAILSLMGGADLWWASWSGNAYRAIYNVNRFAGMSLGIVCGIIGWWASRWHSPVERNAKAHALLLSAKLGAESFAFLVLLVFPSLTRWSATGMGAATIACYLGWTLLLTVRGERGLKMRPFTETQLERMDSERDALLMDFQRFRPFRRSHQRTAEQIHSDRD